MTIYLSGDLAVKSGDQVSMSFREKEFSWVVGTVISKGCDAYVLRRDDFGVISFDANHSFTTYECIDDLVDALAKAGFIVNGTIDFRASGMKDYIGEYKGRYHIQDNEVRALNEHEMHVEDADDQTLINELAHRGFTVIKNSNETKA